MACFDQGSIFAFYDLMELWKIVNANLGAKYVIRTNFFESNPI